MKEENPPQQAIPFTTLLAEITDCRVPKNDREWAAHREIERLTKYNERLLRCLENARGWIAAEATNPVHDLLAYTDSVLRNE